MAAFLELNPQLINPQPHEIMKRQTTPRRLSKKLQKRAHQSLSNPTLSTDPVTGERHMRHQMTADGFYRGKKVVEIKQKEEALEE